MQVEVEDGLRGCPTHRRQDVARMQVLEISQGGSLRHDPAGQRRIFQGIADMTTGNDEKVAGGNRVQRREPGNAVMLAFVLAGSDQLAEYAVTSM